MASAIQDLLSNFAVTFLFGVVYHGARGTITIQATSEGIDSNYKFIIPYDVAVQTWMNNTGFDHPWKNREGTVQSKDINNLQSINGVLRNTY